MLRRAYYAGCQAAFKKFALSPPTPADTFANNIADAKDVPVDPTSSFPEESPGPNGVPSAPMPTQEETPPSLGSTVGTPPAPEQPKQGALGLKDMLFFENMMGPDEARSMFQNVQQQMTGQGGGRHGTLNITPQGPQFTPQPKSQMPAMQQRPAPSLGAQAAHNVISSAPPPPRMPLKR